MSPPTILVVHANGDVVAAIRAALEPLGMPVRVAGDGLEGLSAVDRELPALILMDTMLPRLDGVSLLNALRSRPDTGDTPVIFISGCVEPLAMLSGLAAGARQYVTLPFQDADLLARVRRLLGL